MAMQEVIRDLSEDFITFEGEPRVAREYNRLIADIAVFWYNSAATSDWRHTVNSEDVGDIFENVLYYPGVYDQMILLGYANVFKSFAHGEMADIIDSAMLDALEDAHELLIRASRV